MHMRTCGCACVLLQRSSSPGASGAETAVCPLCARQMLPVSGGAAPAHCLGSVTPTLLRPPSQRLPRAAAGRPWLHDQGAASSQGIWVPPAARLGTQPAAMSELWLAWSCSRCCPLRCLQLRCPSSLLCCLLLSCRRSSSGCLGRSQRLCKLLLQRPSAAAAGRRCLLCSGQGRRQLGTLSLQLLQLLGSRLLFLKSTPQLASQLRQLGHCVAGGGCLGLVSSHTLLRGKAEGPVRA